MQKLYHFITIFILLMFLISSNHLFAQVPKFQFEETKSQYLNERMPLAITNTPENMRVLNQDSIMIKYESKDWIHFQGNIEWVEQAYLSGKISDFYWEYAPPHLLDDTARAFHSVDEIHNGNFPLPAEYTGKNIIVGIVDTGIDHNHPDFISPQGNKRLIRYWDHSISNPSQSPQPYGYGQIWTQQDITSGLITSNEVGTAHGSTVSGMAVGNGLGNGNNKGIAPEALIIAVKTNFSLPNWTLTIADACDFIFKTADTLGVPAIVNLSLGSYLGSHDALDPAGIYIDNLLSEKNGRIVVCAAGNSGNAEPYHVENYIDIDTSFTWFRNNSSGSLGPNTIFFDLWTDLVDANFDFAFGAHLPSGTFDLRAQTNFYNITSNMGNIIFDTLYNEIGQRIATLEVYRNIVGSNLQMQVLFSKVDSTNYNFAFFTTGDGKYDLWSGEFFNFNKIVSNIPSSSQFPNIVNYVLPDNLQSIVSSWNCSEKVVSVGNLMGRQNYIDNNGNLYQATNNTPTGTISINSSRGPTRKGVVKPDISAMGDVTLAAGSAWVLNNPANNSAIQDGGLHVRNGGTSMASPVVAGTAALYLEKCSNSNWQDFKQHLFENGIEDNVTGSTPNFEYGYGKLDAFGTLVSSNQVISVIGDTVLCQGNITLSTAPPLDNYLWYNNATSSSISINSPGEVYVEGTNNKGCKVFSDTINITTGTFPPTPTITVVGDSLISSQGPNYQWYLNDSPLQNDTNFYLIPTNEGFYSVSFTNESGCSSFSNAIPFTLSLSTFLDNGIQIFPNPAKNKIHVVSDSTKIEKLNIYDQNGRIILKLLDLKEQSLIDIQDFSTGTYIVQIVTHSGVFSTKLIKSE